MDVLIGVRSAFLVRIGGDVVSKLRDPGGAPVGHALFDPAMDTEFGQSIGGMIWPRGFVGAAAFWSFDAATDPASPAFAASIYKLSDSLAARGSLVCPTNCSCDQLSACGKPYIQPKPLGPGAPVGLSECDVPGEAASHQTWSLSENGTVGLGGAGGLLCLATGPTAYPLVLASCDPAAASAWKHDPASAEFVLASSGHCIDADHTAHTVGYVTSLAPFFAYFPAIFRQCGPGSRVRNSTTMPAFKI